MKTLVLYFILIAQSFAGPSVLKAIPEIRMNRESVNKVRISDDEVRKRVQAFYDSREQFTLEELNDLGIKTLDGRIVKLSQIASIKVTFRKDTQTGFGEQGAANQPATPKESK